MRIRLALLGLLLCAPLAAADEVVFYRCTDASGALTMQNMPCPKGDRQEKKVMQAVSTMPMATPASTPRPVAAQPAPGIAEAALSLPEENWSNLTPAFALCCARHETQYSRLFRS